MNVSRHRFVISLLSPLIVMLPYLFISAELSASVGDASTCWCDRNYSTYEDWMRQGRSAKSSKKKIACFTRALQYANTNAKLADAYYERGYATYYYVLDVMGETWSSSGASSLPGQIMDDNGTKAITEEALVPRDKRRDDGYADYKLSLAYNPDHSDALFESGVYWYWKAYRESVKDNPNSANVSGWYNTSHSFLTECIKRDKWCSTAYDIRSRIRNVLGNNSGKQRDLTIRDLMRQPDQSTQGSGLFGFFFWNTDLTDLRKTRVDGTINFDWGGGGPGDIGDNNYSIRWLGLLNPPSEGDYTFTTYSDDGVRLWINYKLVIDQWNDHAGTFHTSSTVKLKLGRKVAVKLEFYERTGEASCRLYWTPPGGTLQIIPQSNLYPVPDPVSTRFPKLWQHLPGNPMGWSLELDKGSYGIWTGDYNDNLTSLTSPSLFDVVIYEHGFSGHSLAISGPYTITNLSDYSMDSDHSWNDTVSSVDIKCKSGFGE